MELNELMIGDWIAFPINNGPTKVTSIEDINGKTVINYSFNIRPLFGGDYKPINISREILINNGFIKKDDIDEEYYEYENEDGIEFIIFYEDNKPSFVHIMSDKQSFVIERYISYVHELQHMIKICQINKEIEL